MLNYSRRSINIHTLFPLNARQRRFAEEYLVDHRAKAAAIRAGYSEKTAAQIAWRLLHDPKVAGFIRTAERERSDRLRVSLDRVVLEHARIGLADIGRIVRFTRKGPRLRPGVELGPDETAALREVTRRKGGFQVKLYDKQRSLDLLTKILGVVERFQAEGVGADAEDRAQRAATQRKFGEIVEVIRAELGIDRNSSHMQVLAEGVARGDEAATLLAKKIGHIRRKDDPPE